MTNKEAAFALRILVENYQFAELEKILGQKGDIGVQWIEEKMTITNGNIKRSILLVDDNPNNLKLLAEILTENGFQVRASNSGRYALKSIKLYPPDLILLDIRMPEMDGYEVCRQLKADPLFANIPVIFIRCP